MAASLGGLEAWTVVLGALPADFPAPIAIVQHRAPDPGSVLEYLLSTRMALRVQRGREGALLTRGTVHVAPPDFHLVINPDRSLSLLHGAKVKHSRPAADVLFESAALSLGCAVLGVILTGGGSDGTDGAVLIRSRGGVVIAQDASAKVCGMPHEAVEAGGADLVLPLAEIAPALLALVGRPAGSSSPAASRGGPVQGLPKVDDR
jgi:two-component system chemotaxis response regulator CheB